MLTVRAELDLGDDTSVADTLDELWPWAVVNAAGYVRVDDAEDEEERCRRENVDGPERLAAHCARRGMQLVTFSSDLVFDGAKRSPYVESDPVAPLGAYGRSKADAERRVLEAMPSALVARTSAFFGPWDEYNFVTLALGALSAGKAFGATAEVVSPTYVPDLCDAVLDLLIDGERGVWHLAGPSPVSWLELARAAARHAGVDAKRLRVGGAGRARRPRYSALGSERGLLLPSLDDALARYVSERRDYAATQAVPA